FADDLLRFTHRIPVRGVDEGDPFVERTADDPDAVLVVGVAPAPERHGAETDARDLQAAVAERRVVHVPSAPTLARGLRTLRGGSLDGDRLRDRCWLPCRARRRRRLALEARGGRPAFLSTGLGPHPVEGRSGPARAPGGDLDLDAGLDG